MKTLRSKLSKITLFDSLLILIFICGLIFFAVVFFRKTEYVTVVVKVGEDDVRYYNDGSRNWFGNLFYIGMKDVGDAGRVQSEVTDIMSYATSPNAKVFYLTVKLRGFYSKSSGKYTFQGRPVAIGYPIKLQFSNISVNGLITNVQGVENKREEVKLILETQLWNESVTYKETSGVKPYLTEAVGKGDQILDNKGNIIAKIVNKRVEDAKIVSFNTNGAAVLGRSPILKDLYLTIEVNAFEIDGKYYLFEDIPISVGAILPLSFPNISIYPDVTKITINN